PQAFESLGRDLGGFEYHRLLDHRAGAVALASANLDVGLVDVAAVVAPQAGISRIGGTVLAKTVEIRPAVVWIEKVPVVIGEGPELSRKAGVGTIEDEVQSGSSVGPKV